MNTFDSLQALFLHDLQELHQLRKRGWLALPMTRVVKEEHLGRCCYLAEEFLSSEDLCALKQDLELDEQQWRSFKEKLTCQ
jgi:hypothetical protein